MENNMTFNYAKHKLINQTVTLPLTKKLIQNNVFVDSLNGQLDCFI